MAAVKQYHKLFEATFLEHRKLFEATFSGYRQLFGLNQNRRPRDGDFIPVKLLLIILCLRIPQLTVHPAVIGKQLAVSAALDYLPLIEHRYPIAEAAGG